MMRIGGAICIFYACGYCGHLIAKQYKREERLLLQLCKILEEMKNRLCYQLEPLENLLCMDIRDSELREIFLCFQGQLQKRQLEVSQAVELALRQRNTLPKSLQEIFRSLGSCLGKFDLEGQLKELELISLQCVQSLENLRINHISKLKTYQTLSLCLGAALGILLL